MINWIVEKTLNNSSFKEFLFSRKGKLKYKPRLAYFAFLFRNLVLFTIDTFSACFKFLFMCICVGSVFIAFYPLISDEIMEVFQFLMEWRKNPVFFEYWDFWLLLLIQLFVLGLIILIGIIVYKVLENIPNFISDLFEEINDWLKRKIKLYRRISEWFRVVTILNKEKEELSKEEQFFENISKNESLLIYIKIPNSKK